jgi:hypothetical protein
METCKTVEEKGNGISVIICSIKPELCHQILENIKNTIGTDFETIVFDNREKKYGISQVYNDCARKAIFPYLCFVHEDVIISTSNWGKTMIAFAEKTTDCGIIGFAGGTIAKKNFISWWCEQKGCYRFYQPSCYGDNMQAMAEWRLNNSPPHTHTLYEGFSKVVTLDGFFLFVSKAIWKENPFDEKGIKGFHFYDADFSFGVAQKWQNYVCMIVDICHFSEGKRDKTFFENARFFQKKWKRQLPHIIGKQKIELMEEFCDAIYLLCQSRRYGFTIKDSIKHYLEINGWFCRILLCIWILVRVWKKITRKI